VLPFELDFHLKKHVMKNSGPNPIKLFSASIYATLKKQPIREAQRGRVTTLIGQNYSVASIEAEKSFIGLGPGKVKK